jgi:hypothetical protein
MAGQAGHDGGLNAGPGAEDHASAFVTSAYSINFKRNILSASCLTDIVSISCHIEAVVAKIAAS